MLKKGEEIHHQKFYNHRIHGSKKILHNSFSKPDIKKKISNAPGDVNKFNTSTFKPSNAPGDVHTKYFRKLHNKCKTRTIFGQQTKEAHQHISFKSSTHDLKPTLIPSLKKIEDTSHLVQSNSSRTNISTKTASSMTKSISINVFLP